jgi:hypothetical protein
VVSGLERWKHAVAAAMPEENKSAPAFASLQRKGAFLYYPSRQQIPEPLAAFLEFTRAHTKGLMPLPSAEISASTATLRMKGQTGQRDTYLSEAAP